MTHGAAAAESWVNDIQDVMALFICDLNVDKAVAELERSSKKHLR